MTQTTAFDLPNPAPAAGVVVYLRRGRKVWGRGQIVDVYENGSVKIRPSRTGWKTIVVTPEELNAVSKPGAPARPAPARPAAPALLVPATPPPSEVDYWWPLWKLMHDDHGLILIDDECHQIARAVDACRAKDQQEASA